MYDAKSNHYFDGARHAFVDELPQNSNGRMLEIGCGKGNTGALALAKGKCSWCTGIELCEEPAAEARTKLNEVILGDIEQLTLNLPLASFDILVMSEVLEHLRYPAEVLVKLRPFLKSGAIVMAGSPNVCHYSVFLMMLGGEWRYQREGIMDDTHMRWFTSKSYRRLFETAGYVVDDVGPATPIRLKARIVNALFLNHFTHLFHTQIKLRARRA